MEIKYFKSPARLLNRHYFNKKGLNLSKEVLWVSVGQRAADLRAVKVGGQKTVLPNGRRSNPPLLTYFLFKSLVGLFRYFISIQSDLISIVFM